jgi:pyrroloquinoline quinone (PQQ) biosynthesis protein C
VLPTTAALAETLETEIASLRESWSLDEHPFMQRWFSGGLAASELQSFAAEHYHALFALQRAARRATALSDGLLAEELNRYADDQEQAIELWCEFAVTTGWGRSAWYFAADPLPETAACASAWSGDDRSLTLHLVTIYAAESAFSELAPRQRKALTARYGFDEYSTRYFRFVAERSADAALTAKAALTSLLPLASNSALVDHAELIYRSYSDLLRGVQMLAEDRL